MKKSQADLTWPRRTFLQAATASSVGFGFNILPDIATGRTRSIAGLAASSARNLRIESITRTTVRIPYRNVPRQAMDRELPHWRYSEILEVRLSSGVIGVGETLLYYTWGVPSDRIVKKLIGQNAMSVMWNTDLGAGLQMALFDAVAKSNDVPIHALLGRKVNARTPLSWWNIDTSAEAMASECATAHKKGYLSYKTKGRPWFDIWKQVELASRKVPVEFKIDMDFNSTLRTADKGIPILKGLEKYPQIDIFESPIPQGDVGGNRRIHEATRVQIALHYGTPAPETCVSEKVCDGFVVGGNAARVMAAGRFCEEANLKFWLQLVGTGITAAYSLHFGGVLRKAEWPAVNCHQLFVDDLLVKPIEVRDGTAEVPDQPGLGHELNRESLRKYRVDRPTRRPDPPRLIRTRFADGETIYTANNGQVNFMLTAGNNGSYGYYRAGADTELVPDDGSARWKEVYQEARKQGPSSIKW